MAKWEFQQIAPTPARGKFNEAYFTHPRWWAEPKLDGDRRIGQFTTEGVRFTGRRVSDKDGLMVEKTENVPHLAYEGKIKALEGTVLDGEFILKGKDGLPTRSKDVTSIMGSSPAVAVAKQKARGLIQWMVFDCLYYKGKDVRGLPLHERREYARKALAEWGNANAELIGVELNNKQAFLGFIWGAGGEGVILKNMDSHYFEEKKWVKIKREETADVVIMGYEDPEMVSEKSDGTISTTKFHEKGWIGAVVFGQYKEGVLTECGRCSGMTDDLRKELSENKTAYLGRVVEIEFQEREPTGKFRHPRWNQLRDNKNPKDCTWGVT